MKKVFAIILIAATCAAHAVLFQNQTATLTAFYPLNEGSGTTTLDASINNVKGTLSPNTSWVGGKIGTASVSFFGGYVLLGTSSTLESPPCTFMAWIYPNTLNYYSIIGNSANGSPEFRMDTDGGLEFLSCNLYSFGESTTKTIAATTWQHVAMTWTTGGTITYYINGVAAGTVTGSHAMSYGTNCIGRQYNISYAFNGYIDNVQIYSSVLTAAQIQQAAAIKPN